MGKKERRAYLEAIHRRYRGASLEAKRAILDEFCAVCGFHRKYAIRLLAKPLRAVRKPKRPGRKPRYAQPQVLEALKRIGLAADQPCGKRLRAALPIWLPHYEREFGALNPEAKALLERMSASSIDRHLKPIRAKSPRKGLSGTKPGSLLKTQIPIRTDHWDVTQPGFVEADTVAHCGMSLAGDFVWSLTLTDIFSGWTEARAVWNKGAAHVVEQIRDIEASWPFGLKGFDCDNGSEFLNHHLVRYFAKRKEPVGFTRSRPYHKNDNAHVEQKNWTVVRQLLGYQRFDNLALVRSMNALYANEYREHLNFFCPSFKLKNKERLGSKLRKTYEIPQTPYQRLMQSPHVSKAQQQRLKKRFSMLNPFDLKRRIQAKLNAIFNLLPVTSNSKQ